MRRKVVRLSPLGFGHVEKEIKLASGRVGTKPVDRLRWLLDFAEEDLAALSQGQLSDRGWEVAAILLPPDFQSRTDYTTGLDLLTLTQPIRNGLTKRVPEQLVQKFHHQLKQGLDSLFKGPGWEISEPEKRKKLILIDPPHYGSAVQVDIPRPEDRLIMATFNLFEAERGRWGNCGNPNCKRPFVTARKGRAMFCSPRCSAYVRVNKARGKTEKLKGG